MHPYEKNDIRFWKITIGLTIASLLNFANLYIVQPLLPIYSREFNLSPSLSSLALSLTTLSLVVGLLFFGFLSDRIGRIPIIRWTLALSVIPLLVIPLVHSFWWILGWRLFTGFIIAGLPAVAVAYISEEISYKAQGLAVSLYIASNGLGGMLGRVLSGQLADHYSWEVGFYVTGIMGAFIWVNCLLLLPRSRFFEQHQRSIKQDLVGMAFHLKNAKLVYAFLFGFMLQIAFSGIWTYTPFYLENAPFLLSTHAISLFYLTYMLGVIGSPMAGRLSANYPLLGIIRLGVFIMITGTLVTIFKNVVLVIIGLSFVCLGFFIVHSLVSTWVGTKATHHRSGATSFYLFSYYMGTTVGGTAVGVLWSGFGWLGVVVVCMIAPLISGFLFVKEAKKEQMIQDQAKIM